MSWLVWGVVAVALVALAAAAAWWVAKNRRRSAELRERFGPEYDHAVKQAGSRRKGEAELVSRQERRESLEIVPLPPEHRERYAGEWEEIQGQFVDAPVAAVARADALVTTVMAERGYPMDAFEQRAAVISVDHPEIVDNFRQAHQIYRKSDDGNASTEDLRRAIQNYRALFDDLLDGEPRERRPETTAPSSDPARA
jgi:hypothetical protein